MEKLQQVNTIRRCQAGDHEAFTSLFEEYQSKVWWIARQVVRNEEDAKEISQETFIRVFQSISKFDLKSNFYSWIYRITYNLSIDFLRKYRNFRKQVYLDDTGEIPSKVPMPENRIEIKEREKEVQEVLDRMPAEYRMVLIFREIEELSCKEIAKIVNCNENTARWKLFKARELFRKYWDQSQGV